MGSANAAGLVAQQGSRRSLLWLDEGRLLGAVGGAAALAFAAVFALAAVVAGFTAALALAVVFAFTRVLRSVLVLSDVAQPGFGSLGGVDLRALSRCVSCYGGSAYKT